MKNFKTLFVLLLTLFMQQVAMAQNEEVEKDAPKKIVSLQYFNNNNKMQYLLLKSILKKGKEITPVQTKTYSIYMGSAGDSNLVAAVTTDKTGRAKAFIPESLKDAWMASGSHTFLVMQGEEEVVSDYMITKSKISIDTTTEDGVHSITATVMKWGEDDWIPAPDVEMKLGIKRHGGIVTAGEEETYTTDSGGVVTVQLIRDSMPGDAKGNYLLAARVDDNDELGNLFVESSVPWGKKAVDGSQFFEQRTLWTTSLRAPFWLMGVAFSIVIGVWATIFYLLFLLRKTIKAGKSDDRNKLVGKVELA
ncbi:MAG: hypothetical protein EOO01_04895 [Chitinophagaceae bacterium]|nr:MAG: hypothetical protein EOO01_04895 [Chitinophagaceae bacterium]